MLCSSNAADLNAPAEKKATVGSDLTRGYNISHKCNAQYWDTFYDCVNTELDFEDRRNTDTDAFLLGVYTGALIRLSRYEERYGRFTWNNGRFGLTVGKEWYLKTTTLQQNLDILDEQLSTVIGVPKEKIISVKSRWATQQIGP
jgi:hypothetical protein